MKPKPTLQSLPAEILLDIFGHLDYQASIMVSQTCTYFNATIDPKACSAADKTKFVGKAQLFKRHHNHSSFSTERLNHVCRTITVGYACFTCFTVKPMHAFAKKQILRTNKWNERRNLKRGKRRCCIDCQIAKHAIRHRTEIELLVKTSTLFGDDGFVNVKVMEPKHMWYCDGCKALHERKGTYREGFRGFQEWSRAPDRMVCSKKGPSRKAIKKSKGRVSHKFDLNDEPSVCCGSCYKSTPDTYFGAEYCKECGYFVCWMCLVSKDCELFARCGFGKELHPLSREHHQSETKFLVRAWLKWMRRETEYFEDHALTAVRCLL